MFDPLTPSPWLSALAINNLKSLKLIRVATKFTNEAKFRKLTKSFVILKINVLVVFTKKHSQNLGSMFYLILCLSQVQW